MTTTDICESIKQMAFERAEALAENANYKQQISDREASCKLCQTEHEEALRQAQSRPSLTPDGEAAIQAMIDALDEMLPTAEAWRAYTDRDKSTVTVTQAHMDAVATFFKGYEAAKMFRAEEAKEGAA